MNHVPLDGERTFEATWPGQCVVIAEQFNLWFTAWCTERMLWLVRTVHFHFERTHLLPIRTLQQKNTFAFLINV
jgi:hypothetical protein